MASLTAPRHEPGNGARAMTRFLSLSLALTLTLTASAGCAVDDAVDDQTAPLRHDAPPAPTAAQSYRLSTELDVPAQVLLPGPGIDVAEALRALREHPGQEIFRLLDEAGVPLLARLKAALPPALQARIEGTIDRALADTLNVPALDQVIDAATTVVSDIDVDSELVLRGATARHTITALRFGSDTRFVTVPVNALAPVFDFEATTTAHVSTSGSQASLDIGDHVFGLPVGEYAWIALETIIIENAGTGLRGVLGRVIDCPGSAHRVSGFGAFGVRVGHEEELRQLCENGLDLVEAKLYEQLLELNWDALHFESGSAKLVDADGDGVAERLEDGVWKGALDLGQGPRELTGGFVGSAR
jgi:hypothetical protein